MTWALESATAVVSIAILVTLALYFSDLPEAELEPSREPPQCEVIDRFPAPDGREVVILACRTPDQPGSGDTQPAQQIGAHNV